MALYLVDGPGRPVWMPPTADNPVEPGKPSSPPVHTSGRNMLGSPVRGVDRAIEVLRASSIRSGHAAKVPRAAALPGLVADALERGELAVFEVQADGTFDTGAPSPEAGP